MIKVSTMTGKLEGFQGINFNPLVNKFCKAMAMEKGTVCEHCYSQKMLKTFRSSCVSAFTSNAEIMKEVVEDQLLPRFMPGSYVRFLAHGELETVYQALNFILIANANPKTNFAIWTKRVAAIDKAMYIFDEPLPSNLTIVQSGLYVNEDFLKHPTAHIKFLVVDGQEPSEETGVHLCKGKKCRDCMFCYTQKAGTVVEVLRK